MAMIDYRAGIETYLTRLGAVLQRLDRNEINSFLNVLEDARKAGRQVFIMGNGGSAATASHFCCDFNKGVSAKTEPRCRFICLNDNAATLMAYANDVGYEAVFVEQLKNFFHPGDVVVGISGSGNSANVLAAIEWANENGGVTVGLTGYDGGRLRYMACFSVNVRDDDMQISEDVHLILDHLSMAVLTR